MNLIILIGTATGIGLSVWGYTASRMNLAGCVAAVLLSVEFFLPLRKLAFCFSDTKAGLTAGDRIIRLLDLPEPDHR